MEKKIFYHDTDAGGVVYYGTYLNYLEEARTEFLENKGLSIKELKESGFEYAVRRCNIDYKSPARYGDILICTAELKKITAAQLFFDQRIYNKTNEKTIVEAAVILVSLNSDFKPNQIPEEIKAKLS